MIRLIAVGFALSHPTSAQAMPLASPHQHKMKIGEKKLIDPYTKTTLTIIGLALLALAFQNGLQHAGAQWNCGMSPDNPCYLKVHLDCGGSTCPVRLER